MKFSFFGSSLNKKAQEEVKRQAEHEKIRELRMKLRGEQRKIERDIHGIKNEEKQVEAQIKLAAKRGDMVSTKILAREVVRSRKSVDKLLQCKAQINSVLMSVLQTSATSKIASSLQKSSVVLEQVNKSISLPALNEDTHLFCIFPWILCLASKYFKGTHKEWSLEWMGLVQEMAEDAVDAMESDVEEEADAAVEAVINEIVAEVSAKLPSTSRFLPSNGTKLTSEVSTTPLPTHTWPFLWCLSENYQIALMPSEMDPRIIILKKIGFNPLRCILQIISV
ncbi:putative Charged multivesicular body protein 3 [Cardiosporidium cionae]|uniref:Charged multivesicular body protein 3 n=1 Tax=Cardiosporidium cionae TaxID=476202 RepID=A0ABQ7JEW5_9APIC|nr:putative Charged multivesicular body protein 3 [Cardiosporidium cionae]|eukprot:KAF8822513.1 putative Charged multivesicular body protein 3 [Cardiosporidium cionae]